MKDANSIALFRSDDLGNSTLVQFPCTFYPTKSGLVCISTISGKLQHRVTVVASRQGDWGGRELITYCFMQCHLCLLLILKIYKI